MLSFLRTSHQDLLVLVAALITSDLLRNLEPGLDLYSTLFSLTVKQSASYAAVKHPSLVELCPGNIVLIYLVFLIQELWTFYSKSSDSIKLIPVFSVGTVTVQ